MAFPAEFEALLERARAMTYDEGFALSRQYERSPESGAGRARAAFERIVKERSLQRDKSAWLGAAGEAMLTATVAESFEMSHAEGWRWATQAVLDAARAMMVRDFLTTEDFVALSKPWAWFARGGPSPARQVEVDAVTSRTREHTARHKVVEFPWLEERLGAYESFVQGMALERPTYNVAYVIIRGRSGVMRVTYRGTGFHDYWFETFEAPDQWALDGELGLIRQRFKLDGAQISRYVAYFDDAEAFAARIAAFADD